MIEKQSATSPIQAKTKKVSIVVGAIIHYAKYASS